MTSFHDDHRWMQRATTLAQQGRGQVWPNPPVGAVIVKNNKIIGEGWHQKAGTPHAERNALADAQQRSENVYGATIYITLEPCSTEGKTGACTTAIIESGISRCVYAIKDPNQSHSGRADQLLSEKGIIVETLDSLKAEKLIYGFRSLQQRQRPWVIAKSAMSLDGKITRRNEEGKWLTGSTARNHVHALRSEVDAIITSGRTFRDDAPSLTVRGDAWAKLEKSYRHTDLEPQQPLRIVASRKELDISKEWIKLSGEPEKILEKVGQLGITTLLLEAGGNFIGAFADAGLIDEWVIHLAPMVVGGDKIGLSGTGAKSIAAAHKLTDIEYFQYDQDIGLRGKVIR